METNLRQRGIGNTNPIKLSRCIVELERIYGIHKGINQHSLVDNPLCTQSNLASAMGISIDQLKGYKKLLTLIPELQDVILTTLKKLISEGCSMRMRRIRMLLKEIDILQIQV